ncbi:MAG TPA: cation diffusion facilitator family transporter [Kofleriaceae bacterium]|nr:cation diffusion facilitator family transporter [Kofleriaceae bacterium]
MAGSTGQILQSLLANVLIAASKGVAAVITGSGALLAETIHSSADCGNQLLLLLGVKQAGRPADAKHPLGHGRALYFWSFMVAMLLFSGGGVFSIYEGLHKIRDPEPVGSVTVGIVVLAIGLALEGWSTIGNLRELGRRRGATPFLRYLRDTKDSDLVVVFGENSAAVVGLLFALAALVLAWRTGDGRWDGIGSLAVGLVLVAVAIFLAVEIKSLLVGEGADPALEEKVRKVIADEPRVVELLHLIALQQGPGEVMLAMKLRFQGGLESDELCEIINQLEARVAEHAPEVRWSFVEPDIRD